MKVSFLGLGVMGFPMAGHLQKKGHQVKVYNRTFTKAEKWQGIYGGEIFKKPNEAVSDSEIVFMCLGNDDDVRSVVYGENGILAGVSSNAILVDHTTASAGLATELDLACKKKNVSFLDAPVSGGQAGAENGTLTVMIGGEKDVFDKAEPIIDSYAQKVTLMGPAGHGQMTKMMNQICIAGVLQGLSEGIHFAEKAGIDVEKALAVISKGAAQSWQMENRGKTMHQRKFDFGFALDWMRKDLGFCLETADKVKAELPVTALINEFYKKLQVKGKGSMDTSSLIQLLGE